MLQRTARARWLSLGSSIVGLGVAVGAVATAVHGLWPLALVFAIAAFTIGVLAGVYAGQRRHATGKRALANTTEELEDRLRERALLFDVLRASAQEEELPRLWESIAERLGPALRLRELAILVREGRDQFVIRGAFGFSDPASLLGRELQPGEGSAGRAAHSRLPVIVDDVLDDPDYLAFWGMVPREGSFAAFPVTLGDRLLGLLTCTREPGHPLSGDEQRYLAAIADQIAVTAHHGQLIEELRELSLQDELTGLGNRRMANRQLAHEIDRTRRFGHPLSALVIDIDHFKLLNDRCGHPTGDLALQEVSDVLQKWVRRVDTVARLGGEEFLVVLPDANLREAARVAEKLREQVASVEVPGGAGQPTGRLTISIGVATIAEEDDPSNLLAKADEALYHAKNEGRDCVAVYEAGPRLHRTSEITQTVRLRTRRAG